MRTSDERQEWEAISRVGKARFIRRLFLTGFTVILLTVFISDLFSQSPDWSLRRTGIRVLIALVLSSAFTIIAGVGTWQDLERQFSKKVD